MKEEEKAKPGHRTWAGFLGRIQMCNATLDLTVGTLDKKRRRERPDPGGIGFGPCHHDNQLAQQNYGSRSNSPETFRAKRPVCRQAAQH